VKGKSKAVARTPKTSKHEDVRINEGFERGGGVGTSRPGNDNHVKDSVE